MTKLATFPKRRPYTFAFLVALVVITIGSTVFLSAGYRIGPSLSIVKIGTLVIDDLKPGSSIFIDETESLTSTGGSESVTLLPGSHRIIVSQGTNQPWNELVTIVSDGTTHVRPIFVERHPKERVLDAKEAQRAFSLMWSTMLPTKEKPLTMAGGCASVYARQNRVIAEVASSTSCTVPEYLCQNGVCNPTIIFSANEEITSVLAFPKRDDALIIATKDRAFVLELDPRQPAFFAPLTHGDNVHVLPWTAQSIVVTTGNEAHEIPL
ncbi:MAG: hypothetical protein ABA06_02240 [Parcubacteria bacterium C7867-001]|nr:MAG: hypothetical protein ABA06_02240 [Parcubacteria bacterium C7867-001]